MTTIRFQRQDNRIRSVEVTGHAGFGKEGEDIVCSAVSSALRLTDILLEDVLDFKIFQEVDESIPRILLALPENNQASSAQDTLTALMIHFMALKKEYPEFIDVLEV